MNKELTSKGVKVRKAAEQLANFSSGEKSRGLQAAAQMLLQQKNEILKANADDVQRARENGVREAMVDRLVLTEKRLQQMAAAMQKVAGLPDPVGEVLWMRTRPNGLRIGKKRIPLGVIGIIYESRPNVTADAFALCYKTGNGVILRGGRDALQSNLAVAAALRAGLESVGQDPEVLQMVEDTSHETALEMMKLREYIDVLIPRGGAGLIRQVVENATIPVIETGTGNCHIYVDETADLDMADRIIINAKTQRPGVCNAAESLLIHESLKETYLPRIAAKLQDAGVELRGCPECCSLVEGMIPAAEEDWSREYTDYIISVKIVKDVDEAIAHINRYNTHHSESIITESYSRAEKFLQQVQAACVYVNASTRFTDGEEFGFGAEIGISTQKLHAAGPMGLEELTTTKYVIYGNGQIRE